MEVPKSRLKEFLGFHLQLNLHRKIKTGVGYRIPIYEKEYTLINYEITESKFRGIDYLSLELELEDSNKDLFKHTISFIRSVDYEPQGTIVQEMIKVWIWVDNPEKIDKYELHKKNGTLHLLTPDEENVREATRMFLYPDYYEFNNLFIENEEGVVFDMANIVYVNPTFKARSFKKNFNKVSVLMPFNDKSNKLYEDFLTPFINDLGLEVRRGDDFFNSSAVIEDIWQMINESVLIIADLTGKNANVFYEVGIAHTLGKNVILITQNEEDIPFDLKHLRYFSYDPTSEVSMNKLKANLNKAINEYKDSIDIPRDIRDSVISEEQTYEAVKNIEIGNSVWAYEDYSESLLLFVKETSEKIKRLKNNKNFFISPFLDDSTKILLFKINFGEDISEEDFILGFLPLDRDSYKYLLRVCEGRSGFYLFVVNDQDPIISARTIFYEQISRTMLHRILINLDMGDKS
ncbi:hypothetical protein [Paenibacillus polymyxa]|uniref:hypothetical protein n=1 Tax=Paenibacillus polymyxa TaxID=1406 RepID=UPI0025B7195D|nr:hypothetical protein [Paenibacillus polymyxa]MDN4086012.1 hypothetical protein [Paenibacillus polymyxa]MDN4108333.1 hypothetical protein [Paenibacillus polymyxa]